jgi:ferritin-like metal-binding protein YciE
MPSPRKSNRQSQKESPDGRDLLILELQEIHSGESQLSRVLPRLSKSADSASLRKQLDARLEEGERVLKDVDAALEELDASPGRKKNVAAEGLINDAREHVQEIATGPGLDAVLIGAVQKTEHYCYRCLGDRQGAGRGSRREECRALNGAGDQGRQVIRRGAD